MLPHKSVSGFHACLSWHSGGWVVRDLGSRNGTYVNGQRVKDGARALHLDDKLVFGDQGETWVFVDGSEPQAMLTLVDAEDGASDLVIGELRAFPDAANPLVTIFRGVDGRLFLEAGDGEPEELQSQQQISIGQVAYRVHLPGAIDGMPTTRTSAGKSVESSVRTVPLTLDVAPDEETAAATIDAGAIQAVLEPRVHLYLLMHLARLRVGQAQAAQAADGSEQHLEPGDAGWVSCEVLCDDLLVTREQLGLQVFRIRDDFRKLGLTDAGEIVDRRRRGWIRIGVPAARITLGQLR